MDEKLGNGFDDERINSSQSAAFRETLIFVFVFSVIHMLAEYFALSTQNVVYENNFVFSVIFTPLASTICAALILLIGETVFFAAGRDEQVHDKKMRYYGKAFFVYIYVTLFFSCLNVAVSLSIYDDCISYISKYSFIGHLLICATVFLMIGLKNRRVMFNYTVIEEGAGVYYKRVFMNILKLGELIAVYTAFALAVCVMLCMNKSVEIISHTLSITLAGFLVWFILSLDYFILSVTEYAHEKAIEKGRIALSTKILLFVGCAAVVISSAFNIIVNFKNGLNSMEGALFVSRLNNALSPIQYIAFSLFAIYFLHESESLLVKLTTVMCKIYIIFTLSVRVISSFSPVVIQNIIDWLGNDYNRVNLYSFCMEMAGIIMVTFVFICVIASGFELSGKNVIPMCMPVILFIFSVFVLIGRTMILWSSDGLSIYYPATLIFYTLLAASVLKISKNTPSDTEQI